MVRAMAAVSDDDDVTYVVKRDSGRHPQEWRIVGRWHDLDTAFQWFRAEARALRQGRVILVNEATQQVLESVHGPTHQSRW
jgi:hypothetical protein